jgi:hypothetical protein
MTSDDMASISDAAWIVLDYALNGGPSGLDEDTITWSKSTAAELGRIVAAIQKSPDFGAEFVTAMAGSPREVSLLAVELIALALLPLRYPGPELEALFDRLIRMVAGPPLVMPPTLLEGIRGLGFRPAGPGDSLPARLLYLAAYVKACQSCPDYDALVERGDDEYLGHEELHKKCLPELIIESPWACAELSDLVSYENLGMQCDLDHTLWPEFLAPLPIRLAGKQIRDEYADLLQSDSGNSMIGIQKDLYLVKQLMGSWDEIPTKFDNRPL